MTTTVRSVRVELDAGIDSYVAKMKLASRETEKSFGRIQDRIVNTSRAFNGLDKSAERAQTRLQGFGDSSAKAATDQDKLEKSITKVDRSAGRAEASIDRYSGRLGILLDAAVVLTPAALRLGAGALPAVSAGLAGLGAAAGGIGVTVLALHGLGDAFKALEEYNGAPTAQNLQKARVELEKLGPAGADFVRYLDQLEPQLQSLQNLARAGIFPGFEAGISDTLTRLPLVRDIVKSLSDEVGLLASDLGQGIASERLTPFLEYVRSSGAPTLDAFARSAGNLGLGLANLLVAFDPLTRDFTGGLERMSDSFARWSEGLGQDQDFQDFLSYVREAGPEALQFSEAFIKAVAGIVEAGAPLGSTLLKSLTGILNVLGAIASSPFGPALYGGITAFTLLNRASSLVSAGLDKVNLSSEKTSSSLGKLASAGAAVYTGLAIMDAIQVGAAKALPGVNELTNDLVKLSQSDGTGTLPKQFDDLSNSISRLANPSNAQALQDTLSDALGGVGGGSELKNARAEIEALDTSLTNLVSSGSPAQAKAAFNAIADSAGLSKSQVADLTKLLPNYQDALAGAASETDRLGQAAGQLPGYVGSVIDSLIDGANAAQQFSGALAELNGWFDKRDAIRAYRDSIDEVGKGLKDGFTREDSANIDAVGRSILQVAENIKSPTARANFLAAARAQLVDMAEKSGPRAAAALQEIVDKFDKKKLTIDPLKITADDKDAKGAFARTKAGAADVSRTKAEATIDANPTPALKSFNQVGSRLTALDRFTATTHVTAEAGGALDIIGNVRRALDGLNGTTAHTYVTTSARVAERSHADGGTVEGQRYPYGDKVLIHAAPGEEIITNRNGQADRFRADRAAGRIPAYAAGGTVSGSTDARVSTYVKRQPPGDFTDGTGNGKGDQSLNQLVRSALAAGRAVDDLKFKTKAVERALDRLEKASDKVKKSYDNQKSSLDSLRSDRSSIASSVAGTYVKDPFGNGLAGFDAQTEADSNDLDAMQAALAKLQANGLSPSSTLYQAIAASADVNTAQQFAQLSAGDLASRAQRFQGLRTESSVFGSSVADQALTGDGKTYAVAIQDGTKATKSLEKQIHRLNSTLSDLPTKTEKAVHKGARDGSHEGSAKGSEEGTKRGSSGGGGAVASRVRTTPRPRTRRGGN